MPGLLEQLQTQYGAALGETIFLDACAALLEEVQRIDKKGDKAVLRHLRTGILPSGACYLALLKNHIPQADALAFITARIFDYTKKTARQMARLCRRMPFSMFRRALRLMLAMGYPSAGWAVEWQAGSPAEIAFHMKSCLYLDTLRRMGCPELCASYCAADPVMFGGLAPRILFSRAGTLAEGCACCDFTFRKAAE